MLRNHKSRTRPGRAAAALNRSPRCEQLEDRRVLAAIVVDTTLDVVDLADGVTSLREAIFAANTVPGHQEIAFDFGFNGPATILLTEGELSVTDSVTITGDGPELLTIDASGNDPTPDEDNGDGSRVFAVSNFSLDDVFEATLRGLTLTGGDSDRHGGAILNVEDLTLEDTVVTGNHARLFGGGIYSGGVPRGPSYISLTIRDSVISANHNDGDGGGGLAAHQLLIERSEITANRTSGFGGGLWIRSTATILESTISSNEAENQGGGFAVTGMATIVDSHINDNTAHGLGGGVWLLGTADIIDSNVKGNVSLDSSGGGIALSSGRRGASLLSIKGSALSNNIASDNGGGIYSEGSRFTIESSTITSNTSGGSGGGILLDASSGRAVIADSTIASNVATNAGGGLYVDHRSYGSETTVLNSTVSGNSAAFGGGIFLEGRDDSPLEIQNSTIAYNRATTTFTSGGGGISVDRGVAKLNDSIVSNNRSGGTINDLGITDSTNSLAFEASYSLIGAIALETPAILNNTLLGFDPLLGPLEDNGGPTPTHALLPGSPAIDAGDPSAVAGMDEVPEFDQRGPGFARVAGAAIDIGAFEVQTQPPGMSAIVDDTDGDGDNDIADLLAAQRGVVAATPTVEQSVALSTASAVEEDSGPIVVSTNVDGVDIEDDFVSLREAIFAANIVSGHQEIVFRFQNPLVDPVTFLLTEGELRISDSLTITGPGAELLSIDASGNDPTPDSTFDDEDDTNDGDGTSVLAFARSSNNEELSSTLQGVTITGGDSPSFGGGISNLHDLVLKDVAIVGNHSRNGGGGVFSAFDRTLTAQDSIVAYNTTGSVAGGMLASWLLMERSQVSENYSRLAGGGIYLSASGDFGQAEILDSRIVNNTAGGNGGGILSEVNRSLETTLLLSGSLVGGNSSGSRGGGILASGVTLLESDVTSNTASSDGGGIYLEDGSLEVVRSSINGNSSERFGGGIALGGGRGPTHSVRSIESLITDNSSARDGGGIYSSFQVVELYSTLVANNRTAGDGGGVFSSGPLLVESSTIASNEASSNGGGLFVALDTTGRAEISNSTISGNSTSGQGSALYLQAFRNAELLVRHATVSQIDAQEDKDSATNTIWVQEGSVRLDDAIVFGNQAGATGYDLGGAFAESEASFRINDSLVGTILPGTLATLNNTLLGFDPFLGPLQDNGGPTPTHALLPGSPAIDAGDPSALAGVDGVPEFDQRGPGFTRVAGAAIDIGAFEVQTQPPGMSAVVDDMDGDGDYDIADLLAAQRGVVPAAQALSVDFDLPVDGPERAERDALFATAPLGPVRPQPALFDTPVVSVAAVADGLVELLAQVDDEREPEDEEARELDEVFAEWV